MKLTVDNLQKRTGIALTAFDTLAELSLRGNSTVKLSSLQLALSGFVHLQVLDLSNNLLFALDGLDHLHMLRELNLQSNLITEGGELTKLRFNSALEKLDLRYNPVNCIAVDYIPYFRHMLLNLRWLDGRYLDERYRMLTTKHFNNGNMQWALPELQPSPSVRQLSAQPTPKPSHANTNSSSHRMRRHRRRKLKEREQAINNGHTRLMTDLDQLRHSVLAHESYLPM